MARNLKLLRTLAFVVVFGGLIVLATRLSGAAAVVVWLIWLVGIFASIAVFVGTRPNMSYNDAAKQAFAQWRAAHPDRSWGWTKEEIPNPSARISRQDPALLGRITTDPPVISNGNYDRVTFLGKAVVDRHDVLVMERGYYNSRTGTVQRRFTAVSVDTPGLIRTVSCYPKPSSHAFLRFTTGDAEFDGRFRVDAENRAAARQLLSPDVTRFLCADPRAEHLGFTFERGALTVWLDARFEDVDVIAPMIDLMMELYQRIPAQVWSGLA